MTVYKLARLRPTLHELGRVIVLMTVLNFWVSWLIFSRLRERKIMCLSAYSMCVCMFVPMFRDKMLKSQMRVDRFWFFLIKRVSKSHDICSHQNSKWQLPDAIFKKKQKILRGSIEYVFESTYAS